MSIYGSEKASSASDLTLHFFNNAGQFCTIVSPSVVSLGVMAKMRWPSEDTS